ncbi:LOW QUALITY PROTEIN: hypothetical protein CVT25_011945 [Psilocybe cyanescens]|uniref:Uncharacterized protein n=1 Tax=Psilocybe cyanescens TaxID=93625 RepID=A0A409XQJ4_PSICY|nr:LOW QUALITY PROTEIN: hypothetical protein CVT25_011945 [Psilocybe cyanescens]
MVEYSIVFAVVTLLVVWKFVVRNRKTTSLLSDIRTSLQSCFISSIKCVKGLARLSKRSKLLPLNRKPWTYNYPNSLFKISMLNGLPVALNETQHIGDICRTNDKQMHGMTTITEKGRTINIGARFQDIYDEISRAYSVYRGMVSFKKDLFIPFPLSFLLKILEGTAFKAYGLQVGIINRVSAQYFHGQQLLMCIFTVFSGSYWNKLTPAYLDNDLQLLKTCDRATVEMSRGKLLRILLIIVKPYVVLNFFRPKMHLAEGPISTA